MTTHSVSAPSLPTSSTKSPAPAGLGVPVDRALAAATIGGAVLLFASSVAWLADAGELRGILQVWAAMGLAAAAVGSARLLAASAPRGAAVVLLLGLIGACTGAAFGLEAAMVDEFGTERLIEQDTPSAVLALGAPGLLFPVSLAVAAFLYHRTRRLPMVPVIALGLGAVLFPASRIPELPGLALAADALIAVGFLAVARALVSRRDTV